MDDPLLGLLTYDDAEGGWVSGEKEIRFLSGRRCRFVLEDFADDPRPHEMRAAVQNALHADRSILTLAEPHLIQYCEDMLSRCAPSERPNLALNKPGDIWSHVDFGDRVVVSRRAKGDSEDGIYLSLECACDWEVEHGLQIVLREGRAISKLGAFDGHLTNVDAYGDAGLSGLVYKQLERESRD